MVRPAGVLYKFGLLARSVLGSSLGSTHTLQRSGGFDSPFFGLIRSPVHRNEALRAETTIPPEFQSELADWPKIRQFMQVTSTPPPAVVLSPFNFSLSRD